MIVLPSTSERTTPKNGHMRIGLVWCIFGKTLKEIIMAKKIVDLVKNEVACSNVSFSGGKMVVKQSKDFTLVVDVSQEEILMAAASTWVIDLQTIRDKDGADEKVRNLPEVIKVSEIGTLLGKGTRGAMSEAAMVAKLLGCDISKVTPEMIALVKSLKPGA